MNLLIIERKLLSNFVNYSVKSHLFNRIAVHFIHSKSCIQRNVFKNKPFLSTPRLNVFIKRDINFAKMRKIWRIIRLKDRGVEHNFMKDKIDPKSNVMIYKAEYNRICTLGGILFPLLTIIACLVVKTMPDLLEPDPYAKVSFLHKHYLELIIVVSLIHISLSKRYVLRIYFNKAKNNFVVSTWRWYLPFKTHTIECKPGSAQISQLLNNNILLETMLGNTRIGNKRLFITEDYFTFPIYYNVLYGFNEPQALQLFSKESAVDQNQIAEQVIRQRDKELSTKLSDEF